MKQLLVASMLAAAVGGGSAMAADTYVTDDNHTFANFEINHLGFSTIRGRFDSTKGTIVLDMAKKTGSVDVTIEADSISSGIEKFDEHLESEDFFDVAKYPTITFKSTDMTFEGDTLKSVTGDLTMHGVTKPVTLDVVAFKCGEHPLKKTPYCGADAVATIQRSEWGISKYSPAVSEDVLLEIQVEAAQKK